MRQSNSSLRLKKSYFFPLFLLAFSLLWFHLPTAFCLCQFLCLSDLTQQKPKHPLKSSDFAGLTTIIVYRLPWTWKCSKLLMKFIHAGLNTIAMILAIVSMVAVFEYHNARNIPNMYSLHSWIGLTAVIFYSLQLLLGFAVFLLPFAAVPLRAALMPIHIYSGLLIFATVIASALMGITEKLIFSLKNPAYSTSPPEAIFVNCLGLLIVIFGALVLWMASRPHWKRPPEELPKVPRD
uniref:Plasma membrane ascorbate-dependent reductase CYBRD1 n=1 Tax=Apteryx owenii TaxID=8824 RepID=A0A8B9NYQ7_APTOW